MDPPQSLSPPPQIEVLPPPLPTRQDNPPIIELDFQPERVQECQYQTTRHKPNSRFKEYYLVDEDDK